MNWVWLARAHKRLRDRTPGDWTIADLRRRMTDLRKRAPAILTALVVGIPAGYACHSLNLPLPWMIGPMVAVAALNLLGVSMDSPPYARQMGQVLLGSAISLHFTPPVVSALAANWLPIVLATLATFVIGALGAVILSRVSGVETRSTFFASIPGGAMAMANLAHRYGAQTAPVAVAHSLRVSILVLVIPFALTYGGIPLETGDYRPTAPLNVGVLVPWLLAGFVLGETSERLHLHNGYLLMPIFFGAAFTVSEVQLSAVPQWMTQFAQLMFGLVLGVRYERAFFARHKLFIPFALLNSFFVLAASVAVAAALAWAFRLPVATMIISTSPGGMAEMAITAQALQIGVPAVIAFHLARVVVVNMGTQHIYAGATRWLQRHSRP